MDAAPTRLEERLAERLDAVLVLTGGSHAPSYEEAFTRELVEFHESVTGGREPRTPGLDGLRDVALCAAITRAQLGRRPVDDPTDLGRIEASAPR